MEVQPFDADNGLFFCFFVDEVETKFVEDDEDIADEKAGEKEK